MLKRIVEIPARSVRPDHANIFNRFRGPGIFDGLGNAWTNSSSLASLELRSWPSWTGHGVSVVVLVDRITVGTRTPAHARPPWFHHHCSASAIVVSPPPRHSISPPINCS